MSLACLDAASAAGDLNVDARASGNRFWLSHHIAAMVAFVLLPARASIAYQGTLEALAEETSWFILRGIGMNDGAIVASLAACSENQLELAAD